MNYYQPFAYGGQPMPQPMGYPLYPDQMYSGMGPPPVPQLPQEQSYIENIFRLNIGKVATVYMNFEDSQWGSKIFKGTVLAAGKDHLILKDLNSDLRYVLLSIYLNYFTFDEPIEYDYPYRKKQKQN